MTPEQILSIPPRVLTQSQREFYFNEGYILLERVIGEDEPLCESVQRGLDSGALERGLLNPDAESGLREFQRLVERALA